MKLLTQKKIITRYRSAILPRTNSFKESESYLYNINVYSHMFTFFDDVYLAEVFFLASRLTWGSLITCVVVWWLSMRPKKQPFLADDILALT